ncbi:helix-hairpin-helix domain-containing protein [Lacisediminihabitans sp. G11-30]|uniref:Helix-hairpin-helix domain-containing protein n=1 Tax=Lacisediminihabitans changchengi TaxID=2787634 RepID=A0A934VX66_9MICO|nr:helix-hairpin-helix domain-containing protein [Lacisediminihabitans changchengi]
MPLLVRPRSRLRVGVGAVVALGLLGLSIAVIVTAIGPHGATTLVGTSPSPPSPSSQSARSADSRAEIYVHLLGEVEHPGLFVLHDGDRAVDAVAAAGGFTPAADQAQLNLARALVDGEQIVVPAIGAAPPVVSGLPPPSGGAAGGGAGGIGGKVNLNTADQAALETLPRVGPALAQRILTWRSTNGRFTAIEDLMSVTGIGEKTFDGLKELVTV